MSKVHNWRQEFKRSLTMFAGITAGILAWNEEAKDLLQENIKKLRTF